MYRKMTWKLFLLLVPVVVFYGAFIVFPIISSIRTSFVSWNGLTKALPVGFRNWITQLTSPELYRSMELTAIVMALSWVIQTPVSFALGLFLSGRGRVRDTLSAFYFTPLLFSAAALGIAWGFILNPSFGLAQVLLVHVFGYKGTINLLGNPKVVLYTLIGIIAWEFIPFHTLLYQSAARGVPVSLYEAAELDGASSQQKLWHITIPQLKNTIVTSTVIILTGSLTYFDIIYVLTDGGPGNASLVLALDMYRKAFEEYQLGTGATIAVIMTILGVVLSLVLVRWTGFGRMQSQMEGA